VEGFLTFAFLINRRPKMGRCTETRGQRRIGRTIRKLENSVELSSKEGKAKIAEQHYKRETQVAQGFTDDSPVENLRDQATWKKKSSP
jgi:hypothetical protein